jgi:uncharacterized protein
MADPMFTLITGASSGIGTCFARSFAARRRNLVLVARSKDKLESLATELRAAHGIEAVSIPCDLSATGAAAQLAEFLDGRRIDVEVLVNNAGFGARGAFGNLPLDRQSQMIRLNVEALMELTHLLVRPMITRRQGAIINVSSTAGFQPVPWTTVYAATKAFVTSFSLALAEEVREHGIAVVTLCPGGTRTNFLQASHYGQRTLPGGLQAPEEVVELALKALDAGGGLVVPRLLNKMTVWLQRFVPRSLVTKATSRLFRPAPPG